MQLERLVVDSPPERRAVVARLAVLDRVVDRAPDLGDAVEGDREDEARDERDVVVRT